MRLYLKKKIWYSFLRTRFKQLPQCNEKQDLLSNLNADNETLQESYKNGIESKL